VSPASASLPSDKMLTQLGHDPSAQGVAKLYADFTATFVIDPVDESQADAIQALGMNVVVVPTVMQTRTDKRKLARALLTI
jgi:LPPG:FO 2-phospho-L-lactate transferase